VPSFLRCELGGGGGGGGGGLLRGEKVAFMVADPPESIKVAEGEGCGKSDQRK